MEERAADSMIPCMIFQPRQLGININLQCEGFVVSKFGASLHRFRVAALQRARMTHTRCMTSHEVRPAKK
jgi:hypothetical protein